MIELDKESFSSKYKQFIWMLAPFQAGFINVGAYSLAGGFFVSHFYYMSVQLIGQRRTQL